MPPCYLVCTRIPVIGLFFYFGGVGGVGGSYVGEQTFHLPHLHYWFIKGLGIILEVVPTCAVPEKRREV